MRNLLSTGSGRRLYRGSSTSRVGHVSQPDPTPPSDPTLTSQTLICPRRRRPGSARRTAATRVMSPGRPSATWRRAASRRRRSGAPRSSSTSSTRCGSRPPATSRCTRSTRTKASGTRLATAPRTSRIGLARRRVTSRSRRWTRSGPAQQMSSRCKRRHRVRYSTTRRRSGQAEIDTLRHPRRGPPTRCPHSTSSSRSPTPRQGRDVHAEAIVRVTTAGDATHQAPWARTGTNSYTTRTARPRPSGTLGYRAGC